MKQAQLIFVIVFVAFLGARVRAHDFWIHPSSFTPAVNEIVRVHLRVGDGFPGEPVPRNPMRIEKFIIAGSEGESAIPGRDAADPAGVVRVQREGLHTIGYRSTRAFIELEAEKFEHYLKKEGLEEIIAARREKGQSSSPVRETYSRCAKALVQIGPVNSSQKDEPLGFRLELIAQKNPYALRAAEELPVVLLFEGKPCANRLVEAVNPAYPDQALAARTDEHGRVKLQLPQPGMWMVAAVHMIPPAPPAPPAALSTLPAPAPETNAEWESLWASLTFELPGKK